MSGPETIAVFSLTICAAIAIGVFLRIGRVQERNRPLAPPEPEPSSNRPPAPPPPTFPRHARTPTRPAMLSTYDGARRLQRATLEAGHLLSKYEVATRPELLEMVAQGDQIALTIIVLENFAEGTGGLTTADARRAAETIRRPTVDVIETTRAIVAAWIGEEEPMISVPIMKLGDIKVDSDAERKARHLRAVNESRERLDLPPLVTLDPPASGGLVKPGGKPFIVGEQPSEETRRRPSDRKLDPEQ